MKSIEAGPHVCWRRDPWTSHASTRRRTGRRRRCRRWRGGRRGPWRVVKHHVEQGVQLDAIGGDARLSVQKVEEAHARDGDSKIGCLEASRWREPGIELGTGSLNSVRKRTAAPDASNVSALDDHRVGAIADDDVMVGIALKL